MTQDETDAAARLATWPLTCDNESGPGGVGSTSRGLTHLSDLSGRGLGVSLPIEEWRPVPGYEGLYEVSDHGRVRSLARNGRPTQVLKPTFYKGYPRVNLWGAERCTATVHRLVLAAFVGPRPDGAEIRHLDGNKANPWLGNLAYGTTSENVLDQVRHGVHNNARKTECPEGHSYLDLSNVYIDRRGKRECRICRNERKRKRQSWAKGPKRPAECTAGHFFGRRNGTTLNCHRCGARNPRPGRGKGPLRSAS